MTAEGSNILIEEALAAAHVHLLAIQELQAGLYKTGGFFTNEAFSRVKVSQKGWDDEMEKHRLASIALIKLAKSWVEA